MYVIPSLDGTKYAHMILPPCFSAVTLGQNKLDTEVNNPRTSPKLSKFFSIGVVNVTYLLNLSCDSIAYPEPSPAQSTIISNLSKPQIYLIFNL